MKLDSGEDVSSARVDMLPLIDVVFLLLVFFIYAMLAMVMHRGLKVDLPAASEAQHDKRDYTSITITKDNQILLNKKPLPRRDLARRVKILSSRSDGDQPVFINGDNKADLGLAIGILNDLRREGIEEVSFTCKQEEN